MYTKKGYLISHTEMASESDMQQAGIMKRDVLGQMVATGMSRVAEAREMADQTAFGAMMVKITVEQWVE